MPWPREDEPARVHDLRQDDPRGLDQGTRALRDAAIISEFRTNDGWVRGRGDSLLLLHTVGARSGVARVTPVTGIRDGQEAWLVSAAKSGSDRNPGWYFNVIAHPELIIEAPSEGPVRVRATELHASERDEAWARFIATSSRFRLYETRTARIIPVLRLARA